MLFFAASTHGIDRDNLITCVCLLACAFCMFCVSHLSLSQIAVYLLDEFVETYEYIGHIYLLADNLHYLSCIFTQVIYFLSSRAVKTYASSYERRKILLAPYSLSSANLLCIFELTRLTAVTFYVGCLFVVLWDGHILTMLSSDGSFSSWRKRNLVLKCSHPVMYNSLHRLSIIENQKCR